MKISMTTCSVAKRLGDAEALRCIRAAGFDAVDFSIFNHADSDVLSGKRKSELLDFGDEKILAYFEQLKRVADSVGLEIGQTHSTFPTNLYNDPVNDTHVRELAAKSVMITAVLGSKYTVIHPLMVTGGRYVGVAEAEKATRELNMEYFGNLIPLLKKYDVKVGMENMFGWDNENDRCFPNVCARPGEMIDFIDSLNVMAGEERFCACLDLGHANMSGENLAEFIRALGSRLRLLHVHDNDGRYDKHTLPYCGVADWNEVCRALADVGYKGTFSLEADNYMNNYPPHFCKPYCEFQAAVAHSLVERIGL